MTVLTIASHIGPEMERALLAHWTGPKVIPPATGTPAWDLPAETDILVTTPAAWRGAPPARPAAFPDLRWVQFDSVGIDAYPDWLLKTPIVTNARGSNAAPLAEYAMAAILGFEKRFIEARIRSADEWRHIGMGSVEGKVLGLAGYGAVGRALAKRARAFGMHILAIRRSGWEGAEDGVEPVDTIESLIARSDHLVLALPVTSATRGVINRRVLGLARPGLHLINIARGALIEDDALLTALDAGVVARASLDVTQPEPLPAGHRFYSHPSVRLTPHVSWDGSANTRLMREIVLRNLDAFVKGEKLENIVDLELGY